MGSLTINRKRGDDYFKSSPVSLSSPMDHHHITKRRKLLSSTKHDLPQYSRTAPSRSILSRISSYPAVKSPLPREVHAPVRKLKIGIFAKTAEIVADSKVISADRRWSEFGIQQRFEKVNDDTVRNLSFCGKDSEEVIEKDVDIDVIGIDDDDDDEEMQCDVDGDSSMQEFICVQQNQVIVAEKEVPSLDSSVISYVNSMKGGADAVMDLMRLDREQDDSGLLMYKRLIELTKKRDSRLDSLKFEIELTEKRRQSYQLLRPKKIEEPVKKKDPAEECFTPLTESEQIDISKALSRSSRRKVLVNHENSNIELTGENMQCLMPRAWLNDEVINVYLELLKEREKREPEKFLNCHFFNTFFYKKVSGGRNGYDYQAVKRWTTKRKIGYSLFDCDKIFVPIHQEVHWCLAVINKKEEKFQYLDSLGGADPRVLKNLSRYYADEVKDKTGKDIDVSSWDLEYVKELPEQENGYDCGMFMVKYADFYSRDVGLCFSQEHMPYFRLRTVKELLKLRAD